MAACGGSDASPPGTTMNNTGTDGGGATAGGGGTATGGVATGGGLPTGGSGGVVGGSGGGLPTGGTSTGGGGATGGSGGGTFVPDESTITACPGASMLDPTTLNLTPCPLCSGAWCVPNSLVPAGAGDVLASCDDMNKCVPDSYVRVAGNFLPKTCTSLEYAPGQTAEGRCISICVPQVEQQIDQLPQADCAADERCAPCWNPIDGTDTHACSQGCDVGPMSSTPQQFAECGDSNGVLRGVCVPSSLVPASLASAVPQDTCETGWLCAPKEKAADINYKFPSCAPALSGLPPDPSQPAACVPKYIVDYQAMTNAFASSLTQSDCTDSSDICTPCTDPLSMMATGACE